MITAGVAGILLASATPGTATTSASGRPGPILTAIASLPAETYVPGSQPSGGQLGTTPINGVAVPLPGQPVQGFSGIVANRDGTFDAVSDNGFGTKANSVDFVLRIHRLAVDFRTGAIRVVGGVNLTDPHGHVPFPLTRVDRVLTGSDFDPESIIKASDGTYWIGDEFGPFLLHFDRHGRLLQAPVAVPGVFSPENPLRGDTPANLNPSRGFEGMARSPDGRTAYPMLQGTVAGDEPGTLRLYEFDLATRRYTDRRWSYPLDQPAHVTGDVIAAGANRLLVVEQNTAQGEDATARLVYQVDLREHDERGRLRKTLLLDLLAVPDPQGVGGLGDSFRFPLSVEALVLLDDRTLGVLNDNNFPLSSVLSPGRPDDNRFIAIRLARPCTNAGAAG
jgi:hypothetical protein